MPFRTAITYILNEETEDPKNSELSVNSSHARKAVTFRFAEYGKSLITIRIGTRFVSQREWAPPPNPCFRENRWALKSGLGPCYLRSSRNMRLRSHGTGRIFDRLKIRAIRCSVHTEPR